MYGFQNLLVVVLEIYIVYILSKLKVSTFIRLVIGIRSQLYRVEIATMHFCFGSISMMLIQMAWQRFLVNFSWDFRSNISRYNGIAQYVITGGSKAYTRMHRPWLWPHTVWNKRAVIITDLSTVISNASAQPWFKYPCKCHEINQTC